MSKPVPRYSWIISMSDDLQNNEDFKLVDATKWECKKGIARMIRAQRDGWGHIPGTEQPQQVEESEEDHSLFGWCDAPVCGRVTLTAKIVSCNEKLLALRNIKRVDCNVGRYGDFGFKDDPAKHRQTYSGIWGAVSVIGPV